MKGMFKSFAESHQRKISDTFSKKKISFERNLRRKSGSFLEKNQNWWAHHFWSIKYFFKRFVSNEMYFHAVSSEPSTNIFWSLFKVKNFIWTKLALKKRLGFQKSQNWGAQHFWSSQYFFKRFVSYERFFPAVSREPSASFSDPFSQGIFNLNKTCAEKVSRFSKKNQNWFAHHFWNSQ